MTCRSIPPGAASCVSVTCAPVGLPWMRRRPARRRAQARPFASRLWIERKLPQPRVAAVFPGPARRLSLVAAVMGLFAVGLASLHLGKPLKAWRAFLGWRKSWFSREVIVFSGYLLLAAILVLVLRSS